MSQTAGVIDDRIAAALRTATDTHALLLGDGVIAETAGVFRRCFGERPASVVADVNTFRAAGRKVSDVISRTGLQSREPFVFDDPDLHAHYEHVERLAKSLSDHDAIPIAVGSGTVNDIVKLAAHRCDRRYMVVATAASMDGYTAYGASVNRGGSKQTFLCPAPLAVIADLEIIANAPAELNAAGYGDLLAKSPAGADWILADALGIEPIDRRAWSLVQHHLREWAADPAGIRQGDREAIRNLTEGLLMTGFGMQQSKSSRPASGAEHQFSHLWDMQDHHHLGRIPLHGCKVAIGALASTLLYEQLLERPLNELDVERVCANWPDAGDIDDRVRRTHQDARLRTIAQEELRAKYLDRKALAARLLALKRAWPALRDRLAAQLIPSGDLRRMLREAGTPHDPAAIGIDLNRLRCSYVQAQQIRRRYTVLDLATETGLLQTCVDRLFEDDGPWRNGREP